MWVFAEELYETFVNPGVPLDSANTLLSFECSAGRASTEVGDVSWKAVATVGTSIAHKGMINAAKVLAMAASDLMQDSGHFRRGRFKNEVD